MASEPLQYNPLFPTSIWCHEIWVASTNCETCGNLEERAERAQRIVTRYNSHDALVAALKKISNGPWSQNCDYCGLTNRYSGHARIDNHKRDCPVAIADAALKLAGELEETK
jgi:biotin synthase-like enzyme